MPASSKGPRSARGPFGVPPAGPRLVGAGLLAVLAAGLVSLLTLPSGSTGAGSEPQPERALPALPTAPGEAPEALPEPDFALERAAVRTAVLEDELAEQVAFCFTGRVRAAGPAQRLTLLGPDVDTEVAAVAVDLLQQDSRCLLARFAAGTPVSRYTLAVAADGAARDVDRATVASTAPLPGTPPDTAVVAGGTSAPDLVSVNVQGSLDRLVLVYDEPLDETLPRRPKRFSYYTLSGQLHVADEVVSVEDDTVVVGFTSPDDDVEDARRVAAARAAVQGRDGRPSTPAAKDLQQQRGTVAPDLVQVQQVPGTDVLWDFTFDEPVNRAVPGRFALFAQDASASAGTVATRPSPRVVRVLLPGVDDAASEQVLAVAGPAAVRDIGTGSAPSTLGVVRVGSYDAEPGRTTGPDLLAAQLDVRSGVLRLRFDEPLQDDVLPAPGTVRLVLPGGRRVAAIAAAEVLGDEAVFLVPPTAAEVAGRLLVDRGAVRGRDGERSAPGSVVPTLSAH